MKGKLFIFALLWTLSNAEIQFPLRLLDESDGVVTGSLMDSLLLSFPPCTLHGSVTLEYNRTDTLERKTLVDVLTVPGCHRFRRDVITESEDNGQFTFTKKLGYQLSNLASGKNYSLQFTVGTLRSNILEATTRGVKNYNDIDEDLPARSGAMVVITVILSVSIFILLIAFSVTIALSISGD